MKLYEAARIVIGADIIFNKGILTNTLLLTFHDILKAKYNKKHVVYSVSQEELVNAGFGC